MTVWQCLLTLFAVSLAMSGAMAVAWVAWRLTHNGGWIDTAWTFGVGGIGLACALIPYGGALATRQVLLAILIAIWTLRLGLHIGQRSAGITDDPRYAKLAAEYGGDKIRQMFWLAQKQALLTIPMVFAMALAARNPLPGLRPQDYLAIVVLLVAIIGEAVADTQLRAFRATPGNAGKVCHTGLWGWSRHPNYFFEWFGWIAYPLLAIDFTGNYPWGWFALGGPAVMYWALMYISGIPPLEEHMAKRAGYADYQRRTSAFFPWPPAPRRA